MALLRRRCVRGEVGAWGPPCPCAVSRPGLAVSGRVSHGVCGKLFEGVILLWMPWIQACEVRVGLYVRWCRLSSLGCVVWFCKRCCRLLGWGVLVVLPV